MPWQPIHMATLSLAASALPSTARASGLTQRAATARTVLALIDDLFLKVGLISENRREV